VSRTIHTMYIIEQHQMDKLFEVAKGLYGDGSILTSDNRRDLANLLNLILSEIINGGKVEHRRPK
jgi:hypothetical protein